MDKLPTSPFMACMLKAAANAAEAPLRDGQNRPTVPKFGEKKLAALEKRFVGAAEMFHAAGHADPERSAMNWLLSELAFETREKARVALSDAGKRAAHNEHFDTFDRNAAVFRKTGEAQADWGRVAVALLERDQRSKTLALRTVEDDVKGQLWAIVDDVVEKAGKGTLGVQRGKAHLPDLVREIFGESTGDPVAAAMAKAVNKMTDASVELFNAAGGSMRKLSGGYMPQHVTVAKLAKHGKDAFVADYMTRMDWTRVKYPDGTPIPPEARAEALGHAYDTLATGGANKIDPSKMKGNGAAVGRALEEHRFLHFKDGTSWLEMHEKYGDGNVFDVLARFVDDRAHSIAAVRMFGSNPEAAIDVIKNMARKRAADEGPRALAAADATLKNVFDPMKEVMFRQNAMASDSFMGNAMLATSNLLTAAQLGSAALLAVPGDMITTMAVRVMDKSPVVGGMKTYFDTLALDREFQRKIATQSGFVQSGAVSTVYSTQRFSAMATVGPAFTRRLTDATMRASGMSGHTAAARWASQAEMLGMMARDKAKAFDDLEWKGIAERYGLTSADWDALRSLPTWSPRPGVEFLRPIDAFNLHGAKGQDLYLKWQGMVTEQSRMMVPESTVEASVFLRGAERPDTLRGAILHSWAMYKNFPVTFVMSYGRLAMSNPDRGGRLAFVAGLSAGMTLVGALGVQMRELTKGRDTLPMDTPSFWGKALLAGGSLSLAGDLIFYGVNRYGSGPADTIGGPVPQLIGDIANLTFGEPFDWADKVGTLRESKIRHDTGRKAVDMLGKYTPGASSLWWARTAYDRMFIDRLREIADPDAYRKFQRREKQQRENFGNSSWWAPGEALPTRGPAFTRSAP